MKRAFDFAARRRRAILAELSKGRSLAGNNKNPFAKALLVIVPIVLIVGVVALLIGFQIIQSNEDKKNSGISQVSVVDQDGHPVPGATVTFHLWNRRMYVPVPFTPTRIVKEDVATTTDSNGIVSVRNTLPRLESISVSKIGYRQETKEQERRELESMWLPYGSTKLPYGTLHLLSERLMQTNEIRSWTFDSVRFPQAGQISLDLTTGKISETTNSDLVFRWERHSATTNHGECGKFTICAPQGGVWLWEGERLFAPVEGYEKGGRFLFWLGRTKGLHEATSG